ncbi:MAG: FecR family protein [Armatimonadetes bacterium]|nr:FecR family protein [Armatimonadota bacterium]MDW8121690.1 FecR family protein [Armatimonadota bacterium]
MRLSRQAKPKTEAEAILDAVKEAEKAMLQREKVRRRKERFLWVRQAPGWLKGILLIIAVVLGALAADGMRRERKEFRAVLTSYSGAVLVRKHGGGSQLAQPNLTLEDRDVVQTQAGTATIVFPDGSAVQLEPNTTFEVRLLDYARGGVRDRSFMVHLGAVTAWVSDFFGAQSQATVCTPTAVAAVRGTGFRVVYDPSRNQTIVQVVDGTVRMRTPAMEGISGVGQGASAVGYQMGAPVALPENVRQIVVAQVNQLRQYQQPPNFLQRIEEGFLGIIDPFLQVIGLTPRGWAFSATNFAFRTACQEGLRRIRIHLAALPGEESPEYLNPVTLQELNLDPIERERILNAFAGRMLESYRKVGRSGYVVRARARDRKKTLFEMTEAVIRQVEE